MPSPLKIMWHVASTAVLLTMQTHQSTTKCKAFVACRKNVKQHPGELARFKAMSDMLTSPLEVAG
jgi:hypothetical protein